CQRGLAWNAKKEYAKAIRDYDEAIRLDPKNVAAFRNRGFVYNLKKEYAKAVQDYEQALRLDTSDAWTPRVMAWLFATCPNAKFRDGRKAVKLATKAIDLADEGNTGIYLDTLAAAQAETGDFDKAVEGEVKALEDLSLDPETRDKMVKRLELYRQKKPYRDDE